ncbi:MAG: translation initiation factor IF-3 [Planctomycetaceae bacterium]|nr:translation initiation factor IF-3 [Planctomycetaceae bacterium]MBT4011892.1 translation initiation factor IF-3 [Planctomycetaceae bacterium]MBT4726683.1 translation initiation factor IF-3 [Planctomycetaceae bacterium]MBT4846733.1 translation initiation factor IF-3 [Planctomycetaceae bacterium]MBT5123745.1 translation initiation factor IF-3 [Planctomycetaceae bacterium]
MKRTPVIDRNAPRVNDYIRISPIRVIDHDGEQLGVIETDRAKEIAIEAGLDLVEVAPNENPPVCRIMDYGKYKYEKKKKANKNTAHSSKTKEVRLRPKTGKHDIDFKVNQAKKFLDNKDKVQITVQFRGREMAHIDEGRKVMDDVVKDLSEHGKIEQTPVQHGRRMTCMIVPHR